MSNPEVARLRMLHTLGSLGRHPRFVDRTARLTDAL